MVGNKLMAWLPNPQTLHTNSNALDQKRKQAKKHIESIVSLDDAKALLTKLCDEGGEWLLDKING